MEHMVSVQSDTHGMAGPLGILLPQLAALGHEALSSLFFKSLLKVSLGFPEYLIPVPFFTFSTLNLNSLFHLSHLQQTENNFLLTSS